jgi:hypothetical protein
MRCRRLSVAYHTIVTDQCPAERPWFRARQYGWGWTPQTWQGWRALAAFVVGDVLVWLGLSLVDASTAVRLAIGLPITFMVTAALIALSYLRGETPHWRWGA